MRKRFGKRSIWLAVSMFLFFAALPASAAEDAMVVEKFTTGDGIVLYVKGPEGTVWEAAYQAGSSACAVGGIDTVRESGETIYTLILWDNSLSVMNRQGDRIREILLDIMANRASREKFAIALIDNGTTYLTEYTDDYSVLKQAVEAVEGQNQDAYIIENLYEAVLALNRIPDTGYKRIFLISDGMDAVEIGYSKAELDALMERTPYPVYTMGMLDGNHTEELQSLFALSRMTGAAYFYMDEMEEVSAVTQVLSADLDILRISVFVPEEMRDGSVQNSQLVLESGAKSYTLQCQVTLPFAEIGPDADAKQGDADAQEDDRNAEEGTEPEELREDEDGVIPTQTGAVEAAGETGIPLWMIGCAAGAAVLVLIVVLVIVISKKKKRKGTGNDHYAQLDQRLKNERYRSLDGSDASYGGAGTPGNPAAAGAGALGNPAAAGAGTPGNPAAAGAGALGNSTGAGAGTFGKHVDAGNGMFGGSSGAEYDVHRQNVAAQTGRVEAGTEMMGVNKPMGEGSTGASTRLLFDGPFHKTGEVQFGETVRRIVLTDMGNAVRTYSCGFTDRVVIGRNSACCNLAIAADNAVSERHCEIECSGEQFYIRDLGSSNGTVVNGVRISSVTEVMSGTIIIIGRSQYRLTIE